MRVSIVLVDILPLILLTSNILSARYRLLNVRTADVTNRCVVVLSVSAAFPRLNPHLSLKSDGVVLVCRSEETNVFFSLYSMRSVMS